MQPLHGAGNTSNELSREHPSGGSQRRASPRVAIVYTIPFGDAGRLTDRHGSFGGAERYALELAQALSQQVPTRLVLLGTHRRSSRRDMLQIEMYPSVRWIEMEHGNPLGLRFLSSLRDVDVIHCITWQALMADIAILFGRLTGKRVFVTDTGHRCKISLVRAIDMGRFVDKFLHLSNCGAAFFKQYQAKSKVIYGGASHIAPDGTLVERPTTLDDSEPKLLSVGRLVPNKGIDVLLEALPPTIPLTVVGRPYHPEYYQLLQELAQGKRVTFITNADDGRLQQEYRTSTIFIHPGVNLGGVADVPELFGLVVAEAMLYGLPVIASAVGSLPELIVHGETGLLVPSRDVAMLQNAITQLCEDSDKARQMGRAGQARVQELFTWERVVERCLSAYTY